MLPLASLPVAGPYDFDVTLAPNASLAGEEVCFLHFFLVHLTSVRESSLSKSSLSTPDFLYADVCRRMLKHADVF